VRPDFGAGGFVLAEVGTSLTHLLAELLDNALGYCDPRLPVAVRSTVTGDGVVIEVEDHGRGLAPDLLDELNQRLQSAPVFAELAADLQAGLFVVGRIAAQLGAAVRLRSSVFGGVCAVVWIPGRLLTVGPLPQAPPTARPAPRPAAPPAPPAPLAAPAPRRIPSPRTVPAPALAVVPGIAGAELNADGLPQRQPGAHLSAPLRRRRTSTPTGTRPGTAYTPDQRTEQELTDLFAHFPTAAEDF
jgi:hypothetical protein